MRKGPSRRRHLDALRKLGFAATIILPAATLGAAAHATQMPGPSLTLFNFPYYRCVNNYYVATTGNDANNGTSPNTPWQTLQHANDTGRSAGDCVNVLPGTYSGGVLINSGGNLASKTGYVVYRCMTMDACTVTAVNAGGQNGSFVWNNAKQPMTGNYIIIDGFAMAAASETLFGQGVQLWDGNDFGPNAANSVHHVWLLNSLISGYGQSGLSMNDGEYFFVVHNTIYGNSNVGCSAQGSGISLAALKAFTNYVRQPDDANNPILGAIGPFNNAIEWNVVYNNAITQCGSQANPYDTDGNNIIADTFNNNGSTNIVYPGSLLIAFNVTYNAGGRGIHIFGSENITVANNSCYNSSLDPFDDGTYRPCIGDNYGYNNVFFNNIAYGIPVNAPNSALCPSNGQNISCLEWNNAYVGGLTPGATQLDSFSNNISFCNGNPIYGCNTMWNGDVFSCTANRCATNPLWVNVGVKSTGTETTPPLAANFALKSGSPAIGNGVKAAYLPTQSVDMGACSSIYTVCPKAWVQP
jgi:hypothetical protein